MSITTLNLIKNATAPTAPDANQVTFDIRDAIVSATATSNGAMAGEITVYGAMKMLPLVWTKIASLNFSSSNSVAIHSSIDSGPWPFLKTVVSVLTGSNVKLDVDLSIQN